MHPATGTNTNKQSKPIDHVLLTAHEPIMAARAVLKQCIESLPILIDIDIATYDSENILKHSVKLINTSQSLRKLNRIEYIPASLRSDFKLTAAKETMALPEFRQLSDQANAALLEYQSTVKELIIKSMKLGYDRLQNECYGIIIRSISKMAIVMSKKFNFLYKGSNITMSPAIIFYNAIVAPPVLKLVPPSVDVLQHINNRINVVELWELAPSLPPGFTDGHINTNISDMVPPETQMQIVMPSVLANTTAISPTNNSITTNTIVNPYSRSARRTATNSGTSHTNVTNINAISSAPIAANTPNVAVNVFNAPTASVPHIGHPNILGDNTNTNAVRGPNENPPILTRPTLSPVHPTNVLFHLPRDKPLGALNDIQKTAIDDFIKTIESIFTLPAQKYEELSQLRIHEIEMKGLVDDMLRTEITTQAIEVIDAEPTTTSDVISSMVAREFKKQFAEQQAEAKLPGGATKSASLKNKNSLITATETTSQPTVRFNSKVIPHKRNTTSKSWRRNNINSSSNNNNNSSNSNNSNSNKSNKQTNASRAADDNVLLPKSILKKKDSGKK
jgi:hypothetical protein